METSLLLRNSLNEFENNLNWIYNAMYSIANEVPLTIALTFTLFLNISFH